MRRQLRINTFRSIASHVTRSLRKVQARYFVLFLNKQFSTTHNFLISMSTLGDFSFLTSSLTFTVRACVWRVSIKPWRDILAWKDFWGWFDADLPTQKKRAFLAVNRAEILANLVSPKLSPLSSDRRPFFLGTPRLHFTTASKVFSVLSYSKWTQLSHCPCRWRRGPSRGWYDAERTVESVRIIQLLLEFIIVLSPSWSSW